MGKPIDIEVHSARIGKCMRSLGFHILGEGVPKVAPPPNIQEIYRDGDEYEELAKKKLKKMGYEVKKSKQQKELIFEELEAHGKEFNIHLAGNTDGMIYLDEHEMWVPLEIKSMNPWRFNHVGKSFSSWNDKLKFAYGVQMAVYRHLYDTPYIVWVLIEKDAQKKLDGTLKTKIIIIEREEIPTIKFITDRILKACKVLAGRDVMPGGNPDCKYCSYIGKVCTTPQIKYHPVNSIRKIKLKPLKKIVEDDIPTMEALAKSLTDIMILKEDIQHIEGKHNGLLKLVQMKYGSKIKVKKGKKKK